MGPWGFGVGFGLAEKDFWIWDRLGIWDSTGCEMEVIHNDGYIA